MINIEEKIRFSLWCSNNKHIAKLIKTNINEVIKQLANTENKYCTLRDRISNKIEREGIGWNEAAQKEVMLCISEGFLT